MWWVAVVRVAQCRGHKREWAGRSGAPPSQHPPSGPAPPQGPQPPGGTAPRPPPPIWPHLQLLQRHVLLAKLLGEQEALGLHAGRVVLHVQRDGAARLGAAAHVVELEPHQGLHQRCGKAG